MHLPNAHCGNCAAIVEAVAPAGRGAVVGFIQDHLGDTGRNDSDSVLAGIMTLDEMSGPARGLRTPSRRAHSKNETPKKAR